MTPTRLVSGEGAPASTVSALVLRGFLDAVERMGLERAECWREVTALPLVKSNASRVSRSELFALCERAIELLGEPALGIRWCLGWDERVLAPISHLVVQCPTLRRALEQLARFFPLLADDAPYRVHESTRHLVIRVSSAHHHSPVARRLEAEMLLGGFGKLVRAYAPLARPLLASFEYPEPCYRAEYARLFAGCERFEQPFTGLVFEAALLDAAPLERDDDVWKALEAVAAQRLVRSFQGPSYTERVRDFLLREGWPHRTDMQSVACALNLSARALRRQLSAENCSYKALVHEVQGTLAKRLLTDAKRSIKDVAHEMGFADANTFHRAFKTWTGLTPTDYRRGCA